MSDLSPNCPFCSPLQRTGVVTANRKLAGGLYLLEVASEDIVKKLRPGQFIHMQIPAMESHILRRPFSIYSVDHDAATMSILYQTVGFGTHHLAMQEPPFDVDIIGPAGNSWQIPAGDHVLLVAGGVGAAPLYIYAQQLIAAGKQLDVVLGAQTSDALATKDAYACLLGAEPHCATDDGSYGYHGFCTGVVSELVQSKSYDHCACCGPEPMMKTVAQITLEHHIPTSVSLEKRMACGIGACLSCVVMTKDGYKRSCVDGPIFDAAEVVW